jgi:hypothetical protein
LRQGGRQQADGRQDAAVPKLHVICLTAQKTKIRGLLQNPLAPSLELKKVWQLRILFDI